MRRRHGGGIGETDTLHPGHDLDHGCRTKGLKRLENGMQHPSVASVPRWRSDGGRRGRPGGVNGILVLVQSMVTPSCGRCAMPAGAVGETMGNSKGYPRRAGPRGLAYHVRMVKFPDNARGFYTFKRT